MSRSIAVAFGLLFLAVSASAESVSTRCDEIEVDYDGTRSVSRLADCSSDKQSNLLWHLDRVDQVSASLDGRADRGNGGAGAVVYVMDTGVMAAHSEFDRNGHTNVVAGYDVASVTSGASRCRSTNKATDPCFANTRELLPSSHGTAVASLVAGRRVGVAPSAQVVSIRVMNERGLATTGTYMAGLDAIIRHAWSSTNVNTAVVNISAWVLDRLSFEPGAPYASYEDVETKMKQMIAGVDADGKPDAFGKHFLFVVAANNIDGGCGTSGIVDRFPAILGPHIEGLITVGGITERNVAWAGSCRGAVEVLAPAQDIYSATITGSDEYRGPRDRSGTSFAAPIVSGLAARLLSERPYLSPVELEHILSSGRSLAATRSPEYAQGRVAVDSPLSGQQELADRGGRFVSIR